MGDQIHSKQGLQVVVGLGVTGLACAKFLQQAGCQVAVMDTRLAPPELSRIQAELPAVSLSLGGWDEKLLLSAARVIVSPGVAMTEVALQKVLQAGIPVIGEIELFAQATQAPIVAITGANGKSTVTTLVGAMAQTATWNVGVGGNLGDPAIGLLRPDAAAYVIEVSSFQLESVFSLKTVAAVLLNLSPDHLDRHGTYENYCKVKQKIYQSCACPVVFREQPELWNTLNLQQPHSFGFSEPQDDSEWGIRCVAGQNYLAHGKLLLMPTTEMKLVGRHHILNALAALALGHALGLPMSAMLATLKNFAGLEHRCQWVGEYAGVHWYNDSKGTNVDATRAAIETLGERHPQDGLIVLAGGLGKGADFTFLAPVVRKHVKKLIVFGQDAAKIERALHNETEIVSVINLQAAVALAKQSACPGMAVVLSPACASFDMFNHYMHRGEVFMQTVREVH